MPDGTIAPEGQSMKKQKYTFEDHKHCIVRTSANDVYAGPLAFIRVKGNSLMLIFARMVQAKDTDNGIERTDDVARISYQFEFSGCTVIANNMHTTEIRSEQGDVIHLTSLLAEIESIDKLLTYEAA